jgi:polygalacturonase
LDTVNRVEVRDISIVARRTKEDGHSWIDLSAFNTDGIDVSGHNVHIHDVDIWVQDDCIAVKDSLTWSSSNMTFERINASGVGFVIGSILGTHVHNITFKDSYLHRPVKGIYLKFARLGNWFHKRNLTGLVENILYQNITMEGVLQWPIWIGPAQQGTYPIIQLLKGEKGV